MANLQVILTVIATIEVAHCLPIHQSVCPAANENQDESEIRRLQEICLREFIRIVFPGYESDRVPRITKLSCINEVPERPTLSIKDIFDLKRKNNLTAYEVRDLKQEQMELQQEVEVIPCVVDHDAQVNESDLNVPLLAISRPADLQSSLVAWGKVVGAKGRDECVIYLICLIGLNQNEFGRIDTDLVKFFRHPTIYVSKILHRYIEATRIRYYRINVSGCKHQLRNCMLRMDLDFLIRLGFPLRSWDFFNK